jgi:uncharacterized protein YdaT
MDAETRVKAENVANALFEESKISPRVIQIANQSAVLMCAGNFD